MRTIHKYQLEPLRVNTILTYVGAKPLSALVQHPGTGGAVSLWMEVNLDHSFTEERTFFVAGTGQPIPDSLSLIQFIGTALDGGFVWHIYEAEVNK